MVGGIWPPFSSLSLFRICFLFFLPHILFVEMLQLCVCVEVLVRQAHHLLPPASKQCSAVRGGYSFRPQSPFYSPWCTRRRAIALRATAPVFSSSPVILRSR